MLSLQDGILVGAVGAYDWNGAVLKETRQGKVVPPKSSYEQEFPEELKNHGAYLGKEFTPILTAAAVNANDGNAPVWFGQRLNDVWFSAFYILLV